MSFLSQKPVEQLFRSVWTFFARVSNSPREHFPIRMRFRSGEEHFNLGFLSETL